MTLSLRWLFRVGVSTGTGLILGALTAFIFGSSTPATALTFVLAGALAGMSGAVGFGASHQLAPRAAHPSRLTALGVVGLPPLLLDITLGAALGIVETDRRAATLAGQMILSVLVWGAAGGFGILGGMALARETSRTGLGAGALAVALGLVAGLAFGLGCGIAYQIAYAPVCLPHRFCLEPDPAAGFGIGFTLGPVAGLWLGIVLWIALALGYAMPPPVPEENSRR